MGTNDFRISDMGTVDGAHEFDAALPAVTYNAADSEYLVVWIADDDTGAMVDQDYEVFGQRLAGATGAEVGTNDFRISDMGAVDGNTSFSVRHPGVVFNATDNEYLVVWRGDDDTGSFVDEETEIYGQRLAISYLDYFIGAFLRWLPRSLSG